MHAAKHAVASSEPRNGRISGRHLAPLAGLVLLASLASAQPAANAPPDAVIELWVQRWTLQPDGTQAYYEKRHVRLNNDRAYGEFADPRITFHKDNDKVEILAARTRLPGGQTLEVPPYSRNEVGPYGMSGWPAYAGWRQIVLTMSGIEPGCVVETEYRVTSKPGTRHPLSVDVRLDHRYPIAQRELEFAVPPTTQLNIEPVGVPDDLANYEFVQEHDVSRYRWIAGDCPAAPDEPRAISWLERGPRLIVSAAAEPAEWLRGRLGELDAAAVRSKSVDDLAVEWTKAVTDEGEKLRTLQQKLAATFNTVDFDAGLRPPTLRTAEQNLVSNYGTPEEAAALLLALARSSGLSVQPAALVSNGVWRDTAPSNLLVSAYVLAVRNAEGVEVWHPREGRITRSGRWNNCSATWMHDGKPESLQFAAWDNPAESRCAVSGKVTVAVDGLLSGKLDVRLSGMLADAENLRSQDAQRGRLETIVGRVLTDCKVENFSVTLLTPQRFEATVQLKSNKPLAKSADAWTLRLGQDSPAIAESGLPLAPTSRTLPVRGAGALSESLDLTVEWPTGWQVAAIPASSSSAGEGGPGPAVTQSVQQREGSLRISRTIVIPRELSPESFAAFRDALNALRSPAGRTLLLTPAAQ